MDWIFLWSKRSSVQLSIQADSLYESPRSILGIQSILELVIERVSLTNRPKDMIGATRHKVDLSNFRILELSSGQTGSSDLTLTLYTT